MIYPTALEGGQVSIEKQASTAGKRERVAQFYDDVYLRGAEEDPSLSRFLKQLATWLGVSPGKRVLDIVNTVAWRCETNMMFFR